MGQGSGDHHHDFDDDDDDEKEEEEEKDEEEDNADLSSRLHLFSRGLQTSLVQCQ